jgi:hypothetical protein
MYSEENIPRMLFILSILSKYPASDKNKIKEISSVENNYSNSYIENKNCFLCDIPSLLSSSLDSNELFARASVLLEKKQLPNEYGDMCMRSGKVETERIIDTPDTRKRLDAVVYALLAGVPVLIQVRICVVDFVFHSIFVAYM